MHWKQRLEVYFEFSRLGTNWRTEALAGVTTFVTMAYIIFVNPAVLGEAGMPVAATKAATCLAAGFASVLMGAFARYPIAMAPGMGLNAYFAYAVVKGMGVPWETALGAVFISGMAFLLLTATGIRQMIVRAIPEELYGAVAVGIGLFIAMIGLRNGGIVAPNAETMVTLGNLRAPGTLVAIFGLLAISALTVWKVRGAMLMGVLAGAVAAYATGQSQWTSQTASVTAIGETALKLDIPGALSLGAIEIIFVFLFVDMFDNVGTLLAVGKRAGLFDEANRIPRVDRILFCDATATVGGSLLGTSTVVSYIESAAGVAAGGRSGVTAIVTGLLFLVSLFAAPLAGAVPGVATAPALIVVGAMMMSHVADIRWGETACALPAFLAIVTIPLTFSIANGVAFGLVAHVAIQVAMRRGRSVHWLTYLLAALFLLRFAYLGKG